MFAGSCFLLMTVIQSSNLNILYKLIETTSSPELKAEYQRSLNSIFSVQLGIDVCWDIFITLSTILLGIGLLKVRNALEIIIGIFGILIGTTVLILNLYSFPIPPREDGLIDLGPLNGLWFLIFIAILAARIIILKKQPLHP